MQSSFDTEICCLDKGKNWISHCYSRATFTRVILSTRTIGRLYLEQQWLSISLKAGFSGILGGNCPYHLFLFLLLFWSRWNVSEVGMHVALVICKHIYFTLLTLIRKTGHNSSRDVLHDARHMMHQNTLQLSVFDISCMWLSRTKERDLLDIPATVWCDIVAYPFKFLLVYPTWNFTLYH